MQLHINMTTNECQDLIEHVGQDFPPEADWNPALILEKDGERVVIAVQSMANELEKKMFTAFLYSTIKHSNPDQAWFISTAWLSEPEPNQFFGEGEEGYYEAYEKGWIPPPSQDPDRKEIVSVVMLDSKGQSIMMMGFIKRSKTKPPKIVKWRVEDQSGTELKGRFGDAMRKGFADADEQGNLEVLNKLPGLEREEL